MFAVTVEDAIAIHRAHQQAGDDTAMVEARRRWPGLTEPVYLGLIRRIMRLKVQVPAIPDRTHPPSPGVPEGERRQRELERRRRERERGRERRERIKAGLE